MPNQKTSDYAIVTTAPLTALLDLANTGVDNNAITVADFLIQIGSGNLGSQNLIQSDLTRTYAFIDDAASTLLSFQNNSGNISLVVNGQCDVFNRGFQQDSTSNIFGWNSGRNLIGNRNTLFGDNTFNNTSLGSDNIGIGYRAGSFITGGGVPVFTSNCLVAIGSNTRPKADNTSNEIIIGCNLTGNGDNTVTIGDGNILQNYFNGNINVAGLAGVGDRNLVVSSTGLLKVATTTNNILSYANLGSFPVTGVIDTIYIALDTDRIYIWDTTNLEYVQTNSDTIYNTDGIITDFARNLLLSTSDNSSSFDIQNSSSNSILKVLGNREIYMNNLKATSGNTFTMFIDSNGKLSSGVPAGVGYNETFDASAETIGVAKTITHSLGATRIIVQAWDDVTGEVITPKFSNRTATEVDITFNGSLPTGNVTILINKIN